MAGKSNYSILADVVLKLGNIQSQLNQKVYKVPAKVEIEGAGETQKQFKDTERATQDLDESTKNLEVTYQQFRQVLDSTVKILSSMKEQVLELDKAQTEFKKVSDLSGSSLDAYQKKLSKMGQEVGRTGKPNRSEPVCRDGKAA